MDKKDAHDRAHQTNIERLLKEYGPERRDEILEVYEMERWNTERNAKVKEFSPIFVYRACKDHLENE